VGFRPSVVLPGYETEFDHADARLCAASTGIRQPARPTPADA
jgi:hypothetical protein